MADNTRLTGKNYERKAEHFLKAQGLNLLQRNYYCRFGEIDLIMQDGDCIVFVEVRRRQHEQFGTALASISHIKQQKLLRTARYYLLCMGMSDTTPCRFDAVGISGPDRKLSFDWIPNAFQSTFK